MLCHSGNFAIQVIIIIIPKILKLDSPPLVRLESTSAVLPLDTPNSTGKPPIKLLSSVR